MKWGEGGHTPVEVVAYHDAITSKLARANIQDTLNSLVVSRNPEARPS